MYYDYINVFRRNTLTHNTYRVYHASFNSFRGTGRVVWVMMETKADRCSHSWRTLRYVSAKPVRWRMQRKETEEHSSKCVSSQRTIPYRNTIYTPFLIYSSTYIIFIWNRWHRRNGPELMVWEDCLALQILLTTVVDSQTDLSCCSLIKHIWYLQADVWMVPVVCGDYTFQRASTTCWVYSEFKQMNHKYKVEKHIYV